MKQLATDTGNLQKILLKHMMNADAETIWLFLSPMAGNKRINGSKINAPSLLQEFHSMIHTE